MRNFFDDLEKYAGKAEGLPTTYTEPTQPKPAEESKDDFEEVIEEREKPAGDADGEKEGENLK